MKIFLVFCSFILFTFVSYSQTTANYTFSTTTSGDLTLDLNSNAVDMASGTTQLIGASSQAFSGLTNIGFDFIFMGKVFTQFAVNVNGAIKLGETIVDANNTIGGVLESNRIIPLSNHAVKYETSASGEVDYKVVGTLPNRALIIEWKDVALLRGSSTSADATFQLRLYETSGVVEMVYGAMAIASGGPSDFYCGFQSSSATNTYLTVDISALSVSTSSITLNNFSNGNMANLNSAADGSRRTFKFTPPVGPTDPTGISVSPLLATSLKLNWTDNASGEAGYAIYQSSDDVTYTHIINLDANSSSFWITGLTASTGYYFKVYALSEGVASNELASGLQTTDAVVSWVGVGAGGAGTDFNTGTNWSGGSVPGTDEEAVVTTTLTGTVTLSADIEIGALRISHSGNAKQFFLSTGAFTLTINGPSSYDLTAGTATTKLGMRTATGGKVIYKGPITCSGNASSNGTSIFDAAGAGQGTHEFHDNLTIVSGKCYLGFYNAPALVLMDGTGTQIISRTSTEGSVLAAPLQIGSVNSPIVKLDGDYLYPLFPDDIVINSTLEVSYGFGITRNAAGGSLTINSGGTLIVRDDKNGETGSNFPLDYTTWTLDPNSNVIYDNPFSEKVKVFSTPVYGNLIIGDGLSPNMESSIDAALNIDGNFTIKSNAVFVGDDTTSSFASTLSGNMTVDGTFKGGMTVATNSTLTFDKAGNQSISGTGTTTFKNLTVSNTANILSLNTSISVDGVLDFFTAGFLDVNGNTLTINNWADNTSLDEGILIDDRYIIVGNTGGVTFNGVDNTEVVEAHVGSSATITDYSRVEITNNDGSAHSYTVNLCDYVNHEGTCAGGTPSVNKGVDRTWSITSDADHNATIKLFFVDDASNWLAGGMDVSNTQVNHNKSGIWSGISGGFGAANLDGLGTAVDNIYSRSGTTTDFSPFGISSDNTLLPVVLKSFNAEITMNNTLLNWQTSSQINNDFFTVEKSKYGVEFFELETVPGAGTTSISMSYETIDKDPFSGYNYYRLKQTDYDGTFTYSQIESVFFSSNLLHGLEFIDTKENFQILNTSDDREGYLAGLSDVSGKRLGFYSGNGNMQINKSELSPGVYFLHFTTASGSETVRRFVVY